MSLSYSNDQLGSIWYHSEPSQPLFPKPVTGQELFFVVSYSKPALVKIIEEFCYHLSWIAAEFSIILMNSDWKFINKKADSLGYKSGYHIQISKVTIIQYRKKTPRILTFFEKLAKKSFGKDLGKHFFKAYIAHYRAEVQFFVHDLSQGLLERFFQEKKGGYYFKIKRKQKSFFFSTHFFAWELKSSDVFFYIPIIISKSIAHKILMFFRYFFSFLQTRALGTNLGQYLQFISFNIQITKSLLKVINIKQQS